MTSPFTDIVRHGAVLCDTSSETPASDLRTLLLSRLQRFRVAVGRSSTAADDQDLDLDSLQLMTAKEALYVLRKAQEALTRSEKADMPEGEASAPALAVGTRDMATVRTLLSLVFKWGVEPLYARLLGLWPVGQSSLMPKVMDITASPCEHALLLEIVSDALTLVYPNGATGELSGTLVTVALLEQHLPDLLRPCLALGWLPKRLATPAIPVADALRPMMMRLLASMPSFQTIPALGAVMDSRPAIPIHARKACASLLSRQVMRPDGLHGLYSAVFGSEDAFQDRAPVEKLEQVYRVLAAVPSHLTPEDYFSTMLPRLLADLEAPASSRQPIHTRISAFVLSRMITSGSNNLHHDPVTNIVTASLHDPFRQGMGVGDTTLPEDSLARRSPEGVIATMVTLISNCDPSPSFFSTLLSPIVPALYAILSVLQEKKTADPLLRDSISGLLASWGRVVDTSEGLRVLWTVVVDFDDVWGLDDAGRLFRASGTRDTFQGLTLFTPNSVRQAEEAGDFDVDANLLNLRPDPLAFVTYVKSIRRPDIASDLFFRLLESYQSSKADNTSDPLRTLLFLQLIMQMQAHIPPDSSHSDILKRPAPLLSFIKTVLESARADATLTEMRVERREQSVGIADLRIVEEQDEGATVDSDDDDDAEIVDAEMLTTAVNLLLSVLENHTTLSIRNTPILNDIFELMEPLASEGSAAVKPLAREARLVITARLASTSTSGISPREGRSVGTESPQETYQRALKLLQDPILPVRAHGLLLLRELVSKSPDERTSSQDPATKRAFVPAVLSIFLETLQDEDSYIYLNAVQGLSAMVETFGKEVLSSLIADYCTGLESTSDLSPSQSQTDLRVRLGEALGQVIRRCGNTLGVHANLIIPRLFAVARASHFPATLRVSALSLLATCTSTYFLAVVGYASNLAEAMIDLLQLQAGTATQVFPAGNMDDNPTSMNVRVAPMRRSALHLLSLLTRGCIEHRATQVFDATLLNRMRITLRYVASTDADAVCQIQARETLDAVHILQGIE